MPESLRESSSRGKGNYFGGQTAADREEENKKRERQKKDQEKDTMSSGAGDRRRELEAKLSPQMRAQAAAEYQKRNEKEQERIARTVRYSMPRKFARPVEKILNAYNSDKTTLYDILQVRKSVSDTGLKKAYKSKALSTHPGMMLYSPWESKLTEKTHQLLILCFISFHFSFAYIHFFNEIYK